MDPKKMAALKAADLINDGDHVGIGAGASMLYLAERVREKIGEGMELKLFTPSADTAKFLGQHHLEVLETSLTARLNIYFDGCDQFDKSLNALKSGGGIHTQEKLLASMANEFVLVGDSPKYVDQFNPAIPLVLEIIPESLLFVVSRLEKLFNKPTMALRFQTEKEKPITTVNGNWLIDIWFSQWPELSDINSTVKSITGVLETSLFFNLATKAMIGSGAGVQVITK